jgi:hypothetical protein
MSLDGAELKDQHSENEESTERGDASLLAVFERPDARRNVERAGELFLITAVGIGLSGLLAEQFSAPTGVAAFALRDALSVALPSLPLVGVLTGVLTGLKYDGDSGEVLAVAAVGAGLGALISAGTIYLFAFGTFGTDVSLSVGGLFGLAVSTAAAGGLAGLVTEDVR